MMEAGAREGYRLEFELFGLPPINTADSMHWRKRERLRVDWEARVAVLARVAGLPDAPLERAAVTVTRFSTRRPDFENLAQGGKFLLDGLVKCGVLQDDGPEFIGQPDYLWEAAKRGKGKVRVVVESCT